VAVTVTFKTPDQTSPSPSFATQIVVQVLNRPKVGMTYVQIMIYDMNNALIHQEGGETDNTGSYTESNVDSLNLTNNQQYMIGAYAKVTDGTGVIDSAGNGLVATYTGP
jgi:hypothetical protein